MWAGRRVRTLVRAFGTGLVDEAAECARIDRLLEEAGEEAIRDGGRRLRAAGGRGEDAKLWLLLVQSARELAAVAVRQANVDEREREGPPAGQRHRLADRAGQRDVGAEAGEDGPP